MKPESLLLLAGAIVLFVFLVLTVLFGPGVAFIMAIIISFFGYLGWKSGGNDNNNYNYNNNNRGESNKMKKESLLLLVGVVVLFVLLFLTVLFGPGVALFIAFFGYLGYKLESWDYNNRKNNNNNNNNNNNWWQ